MTGRTFIRWLVSFVAFPLAGWLAITLFGSRDGVVRGALGGLLVGAAVGAAQWLAMRGRGLDPRWITATAAGGTLGLALGTLVTGASTTSGGLAVTGLVAGAVVGLAQGLLLGRDVGAGARAVAAWTSTTAGGWALGWFITASVIVDAYRGHYAFGSSGAVVATAATGVALHLILRSRTATPRRSALATPATGTPVLP